MDTEENYFSKKKPTNQPSLVDTSTIFYSILIIISIATIIWVHENQVELFVFPFTKANLFDQLSIVLLSVGILLTGNLLLESWFASYKKIKESVMTMFGDLSVGNAVYIAAFSAVAEELLFRGAIMPSAGLFMTSLFFGLLHLGPGGKVSLWTLWAFLSGLILGGITIYTKTLYAAIATHFLYNLISMILIQRDWKKLSKAQKQVLTHQFNELENE